MIRTAAISRRGVDYRLKRVTASGRAIATAGRGATQKGRAVMELGVVLRRKGIPRRTAEDDPRIVSLWLL